MFYGSYIGFGGGTPSVGGYQVTNSCRFNDDDSAFLKSTPTTAEISGL